MSDTLEPVHVAFVVVCVHRRTPVAEERPACVFAVCTLNATEAPGLPGNDVIQSKKRHWSCCPAPQVAEKSRVYVAPTYFAIGGGFWQVPLTHWVLG